MSGHYELKTTIADVRAAKPERIYFSVSTCWWTHDPKHLCTDEETGVPCDPCDAPLTVTEDVEGFLADAEANPGHFGRHGIRAFEAAHHGNVQVSKDDPRATCFESWDDYNRVIDERFPKNDAA